tara:strand:- start:23 stop:838 length:816 start_codon:yes stop_codon:yes gene_type:complete
MNPVVFTKKRSCETCGIEFSPTSGTQKYCTAECRNKSSWYSKEGVRISLWLCRRKKRIDSLIKLGFKFNDEGNPILNCAFCKKEFSGRTSQIYLGCNTRQNYFCNIKCSRNYVHAKAKKKTKKKQRILNCEICDKECATSDPRQKTCGSYECSTKRNNRLHSEREDKRQGGLIKVHTIECPECGKEFKTRPLRKAQWRITATGNLYCGKKCWTRGKIKHDRKNLTDAYVKTLIRSEKSFGLVKGVIPQFMIEMKREEILFARKAEEIKKNG